MKLKKLLLSSLLASALGSTLAQAQEKGMDEMWGDIVVKERPANSERGKLFDEGNYAMFIHWGLYSQLGNKVDGKTYYGIGEWIMHKNMANIPVEQYQQLAGTFNPEKFDAKAIAKLAKEAGMRYILITAKHHDGFAMFDSQASDFNIVKASPWKRDPMKELSQACREEGLGFAVYYSHFQDWTAPGGGRGPKVDENGKAASFEDYFQNKCLPQVEEITSNYGPLELVWFDTPASISKEDVEKLIEVVRKNQPQALVSGRAGHGLGDYNSLGDMEVPHHNVEGLWESVDTTNDSWAYAWYDENWKTPKEILQRLIACVGRGGTYALNIGPRGDGSVPERAAEALRESGAWIHRYPQTIRSADPSPWGHAQAWGDITVQGNKLILSVFDWPTSGKLRLPGLKTPVKSAQLLQGDQSEPIPHQHSQGWLVLELPPRAPEKLASVIELELEGPPEVDPTWGIDPELGVEILAEFASVKGAELTQKRWSEKFGEWKSAIQVSHWKPEASTTWKVDVLEPGDYQVALSYAGEGRLVWGVDVEGGEQIQNQQDSTPKFQEYPIGWINFPKPGKYNVRVRLLEGNRESASLNAIRFKPLKP